MRRRVLLSIASWAAIVLPAFASMWTSQVQAAGALRQVPAPQSTSTPTTSSASQQAVVDRYCIGCHNQRTKAGGLTLDSMDLSKVPQGADVWERVVRKLRAGMMPPAGMPRPDAATHNAFVTYL